MTADRVARLVARWVRFYTRDLPVDVAERRVGEIDADLHDHLAYERTLGTGDRRLALSVISRMVRGLAADVSWRRQHMKTTTPHSATEEAMNTTAYRTGLALALASAVFLLWGIAAMGIIGVEGDPFDRLYFAVLAIGIGGAVLARFQPAGMARVLAAMAIAQAAVAVTALVVGKQQSPVSSVVEILGLNALFVALFAAAAWLFWQAARRQPPAEAGGQGA